MSKAIKVLLLGFVLLIAGCATPLGQHYGTLGGAAGALIGGMSGGVQGAVIGGAAGAALGGAVGDHQQFNMERQRHRRQYYEDYAPPHYQRGYPQGGYVQPCAIVREAVYNAWGQVVGYREVCR
ncbi:MAG TPA: glycine zipper domain-containing protein [Candidatus Obscuribacterales bacterium]